MFRALFSLAAAFLLAACTSDRCRVYGSWSAEGPTAAKPFLFPNAAMLTRHSQSYTGYRAKLPSGYSPSVLFSKAFAHLDGLGTTAPLLVSEDFAGTYFSSSASVKISLYQADSAAGVNVTAIENPPGGLRGALADKPLKADTHYWMVISGKPSSLPCDDGPVIVMSDSAAESDRVQSALASKLGSKNRSVVVPFHTQSIGALLQDAAALVKASSTARVVSSKAHAPLQADGTLNRTLFDQFPTLMRGIQYGELPLMPLSNIATIYTGQIDSVEYRKNGVYDAANLADHGHRKLDFILTLPHLTPASRLPVPGTPSQPRLVIFSHPLRACKEAALGLADALAQYGFAVAAIDHVEHGSRQTDTPSDYVCGASIPWDFFAYGNAELLRDNVRASALDLLQFKVALQRATAADFDINHDGAVDFTSDKIGVVAMSLGSIIAAPFLTLAPDVDAVVLNTALGSTIELLDQQAPGTSSYDLPFPGPVPSLNLAVTQSILDAGEPINYAADLIVPPRELLVQQVVEDSVVPNASTAKLALMLSLTAVDPVLSIAGLPKASAPFTGSPTRALYQVAGVNHSFLLIPRDKRILEPARKQVAYFLWTHYVQGQGTVISIEK